ncbi:MAG: thioredoxin [Candidatus Levybacteria bacterium RBG_16_35_11]|nr:MAG: thioredoxin [Candidatus Levybacteria bacterium RBG_16_35_11]
MSDISLTDSTFDSEVLKSETPVLVDFWAPWCPPCRILGPVIEELANEFKDKVKVGKLDVDQNQQTASKYGIMSLPTVLLFKDGKPIKSLVGVQSKENYNSELNKLL